jgi:hypothetical protein
MEYKDYQVDMPTNRGGRTWFVEDEEEARKAFLEVYPDAVFCDNWDQAGFSRNNGAQRWRMLVWANEKDAGEPGTGDDGSHAVGEIIRIEKDDSDQEADAAEATLEQIRKA